MKPSDDTTNTLPVSSTISKPTSSSSGWRKKTHEGPKVNRIELAMSKLKDKAHQDSSSDSSDSENEKELAEEKLTEVRKIDEEIDSDKHEEAEQEQVKRAIPTKKITEADLNNMGAKILKAELMGDEVHKKT